MKRIVLIAAQNKTKGLFAFFMMLRNYNWVNAGMPEKSYSGIGIFTDIDCVSPASAFQHQGHSVTAGYVSFRHCPVMSIQCSSWYLVSVWNTLFCTGSGSAEVVESAGRTQQASQKCLYIYLFIFFQFHCLLFKHHLSLFEILMLRKMEFAKSIFADRGFLNFGHKLLYCTSTELVDRVLSFFSRRRNWESPTSSPAGGTHSFAGEGVVGSQFRRGDIHCGTPYVRVYVCVLRVYIQMSSCRSFKKFKKKWQDKE